jgi:transcription initiation factor TFIIIB Brf1 subunit/transcription initiation factor TFIIB
MPWEILLKELNRECVNGKNRMCAMIYLAYREEADYSSALDLRNFEAVFPTVSRSGVFSHFQKIQKQRERLPPPLKPHHVLPPLCAKLKVSVECERRAHAVLDVLEKCGGHIGRNTTMAAAAIRYAVRSLRSLGPSLREIAIAARLQDESVRRVYEKLISSRSGSILSQEFGEVC